MVAILKEHIPLILTFSVSMVIYLLLFMYSRVITSPGLILLRTFILLLLAIEAFCFCIMIRDWRAIQISRLNQRLIKEVQQAQYEAALINGMIYDGGDGSGRQAYYQQQQYQQEPLMSPTYTGPQQQQHNRHHQSQLYHQAHQRNNQQAILQQYRQHQQSRAAPQIQRGYSDKQPQISQTQILPNPYIQVDEEENPYSVIVEPSSRGQHINNNAAYIAKTRLYVPERY